MTNEESELDRRTRERFQRESDAAAVRGLIGEASEAELRLIRLDEQRRANGMGKLPAGSIPRSIQDAVRKHLERD